MKNIIDYLMVIEKLEPLQILVQLALLALAGLIILWVSQMAWFGVLKKSQTYQNEPIDVIGKLSMLRSTITYFAGFAIYFFFLIKHNGMHAFHWNQPAFFLTMLPRILLYLVPAGFYLNRNKVLSKILK